MGRRSRSLPPRRRPSQKFERQRHAALHPLRPCTSETCAQPWAHCGAHSLPRSRRHQGARRGPSASLHAGATSPKTPRPLLLVCFWHHCRTRVAPPADTRAQLQQSPTRAKPAPPTPSTRSHAWERTAALPAASQRAASPAARQPESPHAAPLEADQKAA